jgi:hypothetical protein
MKTNIYEEVSANKKKIDAYRHHLIETISNSLVTLTEMYDDGKDDSELSKDVVNGFLLDADDALISIATSEGYRDSLKDKIEELGLWDEFQAPEEDEGEVSLSDAIRALASEHGPTEVIRCIVSIL